MRVPWTARRSNQFLKEISPEYSLEGLMLKLKLQYFGPLLQRADSLEKTLMSQLFESGDQRADSLEKTLMQGKIEGRRRGWQRMRWLDGITDLMGHEFEQAWGHGEGQGSLVCYSPWGLKEVDMTEGLTNNNKVLS